MNAFLVIQTMLHVNPGSCEEAVIVSSQADAR